MKRHLLLLATLLTMALVACSGGGGEDEPTPTPTPSETPIVTLDSSITTNGLNFDTTSGEKSVTFNTNTDWTLSIAETRSGTLWCTPSATSGFKGDVTVKFTVTENTEYDDRSVSVTIKAGTASKSFKITQKCAEALFVTSKTFEVGKEGGNIEVEVKSNINYQMEVAESAKSWITESTNRALTAKKYTFTIASNEDYDKREGEIYIQSGDKKETVKVYQTGGAVLVLSQKEYSVNSAGETITVDIKSNAEYGVQMPDVDWIVEESASRAMSSHSLKFIIAPNETYDVRSAKIIFYDKNSDLKETVTIKQAQKDAIVVFEKEYEVEAKGGSIQVAYESNVEVTLTTDCNWIKVTSTSTRSLTTSTIQLEVSENTTTVKRTGKIIFSNGILSETLTVIQKGKTSGSIENIEEKKQEW